MIEVRGITKYYGTFKALDNVSFDVARGEVLGFLGPNGAGKSTTMKVLTTYISASEGTARVAGFDVHARPHEVRRRIGYLPETPPLYGDMTVEDYLAFAGRARGLRGADLKRRTGAVVAETGLGPKLKSRVVELSKGFRQRTGLAQALIHDPPVLILDEPTSGLDPMQIIEIRKLIDRLRAERCIIFSTHILQEATAVASRLVIVNAGRKVADGTSDDLANQAGDSQKVRLLARGGDGLADALRSVTGVTSVQALNPPHGYARFEVGTSGGAPGARSVCEKISALCRERGVTIAELYPQALSLEEIFLHLLRGKQAPAATVPAVESGEVKPATPPRSDWDAVEASLKSEAKPALNPEVDPDPFATSVAGPVSKPADSKPEADKASPAAQPGGEA